MLSDTITLHTAQNFVLSVTSETENECRRYFLWKAALQQAILSLIIHNSICANFMRLLKSLGAAVLVALDLHLDLHVDLPCSVILVCGSNIRILGGKTIPELGLITKVGMNICKCINNRLSQLSCASRVPSSLWIRIRQAIFERLL